MPKASLTAAAKVPAFNSVSDRLTAEAFKLALKRGADRVWKREFDVEQQGLQFVKEESLDREVATFQTFRQSGGLIPQNRDSDDMPMGTAGDGFGYTVQSYNFRKAIAVERTLKETDDRGVTRGLQQDLVRSAKLTIEHAIADVFNRGFGTSGSPVLSDDGMYFIDSARPNANPDGGKWANLEATSAITPDAIFQAQLNAMLQVGDDGELHSTSVRAVICRPQDSKKLWEIRNSNYRPTDANNVNNFFKENKEATFDIVVYKYLTTACLYYALGDTKSMDNELGLFWRVKPSILTYDVANPDVMQQRIRFAFGIGLGSPRLMWRGGLVS